MTVDRTEFGKFTTSALHGFGTRGLTASETFHKVGKWATVPRASQQELIQVADSGARCLTASKWVLHLGYIKYSMKIIVVNTLFHWVVQVFGSL